jgi:hypothetical protein
MNITMVMITRMCTRMTTLTAKRLRALVAAGRF